MEMVAWTILLLMCFQIMFLAVIIVITHADMDDKGDDAYDEAGQDDGDDDYDDNDGGEIVDAYVTIVMMILAPMVPMVLLFHIFLMVPIVLMVSIVFMGPVFPMGGRAA